jgi:hypothetical protein
MKINILQENTFFECLFVKLIGLHSFFYISPSVAPIRQSSHSNPFSSEKTTQNNPDMPSQN